MCSNAYHRAIHHGAYYREQTLANLSFLFPLLPSLSLITSHGAIHLVSTDTTRQLQIIFYTRRYIRHLHCSEQALAHLYSDTCELVKKKVNMFYAEHTRVQFKDIWWTKDVRVLQEVLGGWGRGLEEIERDMRTEREKREGLARKGVYTGAGPRLGEKGREMVDAPVLDWNVGTPVELHVKCEGMGRSDD